MTAVLLESFSPSPVALAAALEGVVGVRQAELDPDGGGAGLLRLELDPGADEAEVAAAVGLLLGQRFGLGIDAGAVAILEESQHLGGVVQRLRVVRVGNRAAATVTLTHDGRTESADATGPATREGVLAAVARATVGAAHAVGAVDVATVDLEVDLEADLEVDVEAALADGCVEVVVGGLAASSQVRSDPGQAAVRAALAALGVRPL
jgi:hypothetical protein